MTVKKTLPCGANIEVTLSNFDNRYINAQIVSTDTGWASVDGQDNYTHKQLDLCLAKRNIPALIAILKRVVRATRKSPKRAKRR